VSTPEIVVHRDARLLAEAVAARLITRLVDAQTAQADAHVCLTGGTVGIAVLAAVAAAPARDAVDWTRLNVWWSDERFLPSGDPERNETQARAALLDMVPVDPSRVHPMPDTHGPDGEDAEAAAERYAAVLARAAGPQDRFGMPSFDVSLLGMGPDGHVASLFPEHPALHEQERTVVGVHGSPKPPPTRLSLTLPALRTAREIWLVAAGEEKAGAMRLALDQHAGPLQVPAAGARGTRRTLILLDSAAASRLPHGLDRLASP
jgi:6-phosphogluconolactonase